MFRKEGGWLPFCAFISIKLIMSTIYLSQEGYDNLKAELYALKSVDRPRVINQIAEARDKGDLSENAEYDAAKEAQGLLEARIAKLENDVSNRDGYIIRASIDKSYY
jgi:hypothetical protein